jgi:hypothetical protein
MGETRVDLLHLLEDLRDAYPGGLEETILTEIVANALDSGASTVTLATDPVAATLTVVDDGAGMRRRELARYHDLAASTKTKGAGIGFAGVGIKLGLLICREVVTETRRERHHVASSWGLASRHRAPWRWIPAPGLVPAPHGTAVRLWLQNPLSPLLDRGFVATTLRRQFHPLLDPRFADVLAAKYPRGVRLAVDGQGLLPERLIPAETASLAIRLPRKRKPSAVGYLERHAAPLPEDRRGLGVSTHGKVIRQGWDWLGITPPAPERVGGLVEVPELAACLTLNKADFIRAGARGATFLAYRKAIQEVAGRQLAAWGDAPHDAAERAHRRLVRPAERDLEAVLADLAGDFPLLATLVEARAGGQRRLPMGQAATRVPPIAARGPAANAPAEPAAPPSAGGAAEPEAGEPPAGGGPGPLPPAEGAAAAEAAAAGTVHLPGARGPRRPGRYGLGIQFEERPEDPALARLVESTIRVNAAHPAHRRAVAARSEGYHIAVAAALALAPLAVEPAGEHAFVTAFLTAWGQALGRGRGRRRR